MSNVYEKFPGSIYLLFWTNCSQLPILIIIIYNIYRALIPNGPKALAASFLTLATVLYIPRFVCFILGGCYFYVTTTLIKTELFL